MSDTKETVCCRLSGEVITKMDQVCRELSIKTGMSIKRGNIIEMAIKELKADEVLKR
jgi:hypothetical protein